MSNIIDIGFIEDCEPWQLESRFFPSKIGGKPAWLDLKNIPDAKTLACDYCQEPCTFLCQVYAPVEEDLKAFHRTVYVFICKNPDCCKENCNGSVKVLRSQLERSNEFYSTDPPVEEKYWSIDTNVGKWTKICEVCGIFSSSHCSKCKKANYCCRSHQILDWKNNHKSICGKEQANDQSQSSSSKQFLFPEYDLATEREEFNEKKDDDKSDKEELDKFKELVESGNAGTLQEENDIDKDLLMMANGLEDKSFLEFQERIKSDPEQVLRYNRGGNPLFISSSNKPKTIPNCEECGSERQFEFQIMPQLLVYLKIDNILNSIDWGILAIYTCKNSCTPESKYIKEYVWKQDIVKEQTSDG